jgi:hypothetical protein
MGGSDSEESKKLADFSHRGKRQLTRWDEKASLL